MTYTSRYGNILPYDHSRVKLATQGLYKDYINASWISSGGTISFIAAQGPLLRTVPQFLQMISDNKVTVVVMLTKVMEKAKNGKMNGHHI